MKHGASGPSECGLRLPTVPLEDPHWEPIDRLGDGAMDLRVSVRSLVHQLVHEQAKASVHLEGLQRDVSTLLDFRESVMSRSLGPSTSLLPPSPSPPSPSSRPTGGDPLTAVPVLSTPTDPASTTASSGLGTSTTSTTVGGANSTSTSGVAGGGGRRRTELCRAAADDGDELMSLLETIEAHGRQLVRQTQRVETMNDASGPPPCATTAAEERLRPEPAPAAAAGGARPRCVNCDRSEGRRGRGVSSGDGTTSAGMFGGRRRPLERRRPSEVRHLEEAAMMDPPDWEPAWDRSPLFGEPPLLSLPDMRPGRERLTALSLSERLLQERDALLGQLTGLEQVAVRSQLHAATLQSRLHRVLAVNDALDRELRLAGGQRLLPGSPASVSAVSAEDRMARSTPDLRPPSRIPQLVAPRRRPAGGERSPHRGAGQDRSLQLAGRPRTPAGRPRSPHRQERSLHWQERSPHRPAGQDRSLQSVRRTRSPASRPRSRSRETQTLAAAMPENAPRLVDRSMNATESTTRAVDSATSIGICTASVGTLTSLLPRPPPADKPTSSEARQDKRERDCHGDPSTGPRGIRAPDRSRVTAILSETSPLKLQKELLTLLVEAETLRAQVDSMGRGWTGRRPRSEGCEPLQHQPTSSQADSDDIRLQLEMRNIELEGTRARLRQLEAAWATRPALGGGGGGGGRSVSPRPAGRQADGRPVCHPDRRPVTAVRPEPQRASPAVRTERRPLTPGRPAPAQGGTGRLLGRPEVILSGRRGPSPGAVTASGPRSGSSGSGSGTAGPARSPAGPRPSPSPSPSSAGSGRPSAAVGRRVADLVRGWTEAGESRTVVPASTGTTGTTGTGTGTGGGGDMPDQKDKVRRRLSSETSAKIPATQSQALGQILTALSRGHSPRAVPRRPAGPDPTLELRSPEVRAEVRRLREATAQRLRQARLETSDGEVADSLTSATASEDGGDASLEERLKLIEDGDRTVVGGGGGFRYGEGLVLSAGEGLLQRILGGRDSAQRLKPRPAGE